mmetsp:Transcript_21480/g.44151  ORF Transcript_21480/g.44151 Transcript_21480/m.44151 type:complete len:370 (-) Transcript_21480:714-1823(-)
MSTRDFSGKHSSGTSVRVDDRDSHSEGTRILLDNLFDLRLSDELAVEFRTESVDVNNFFFVDLDSTFDGCLEETAIILRVGHTREELVDIDVLGLRNTATLAGACLEEIGTSNNVIDLAVSKVSQKLTNFFGYEFEEVDNVLRSSGELLSELFLLTRDTHWASVQMANTSHNTTFGNHGNGSETKLFGSKKSTDDNISSSSDTTVNTQGNTVAKSILHQSRVSLGKSKLPRTSGVLDGRKRGSSSTTVATGNLDNIGIGLGNTTSDSSNSDGRDELDRNPGVLVHGVQIMNQLSKILNTVNIMMRRRRNQSDTFLAGTQSGDVFRNLGAWQLTTFTGLGTLCHLNLELLGGDKEFRGDSESTTGDLMDK